MGDSKDVLVEVEIELWARMKARAKAEKREVRAIVASAYRQYLAEPIFGAAVGREAVTSVRLDGETQTVRELTHEPDESLKPKPTMEDLQRMTGGLSGRQLAARRESQRGREDGSQE